MADELEKRGRALEEAFFNKQNEALLAKLRAQEAAKRKKGELEASTGVHDARVLDELLAAGVEPETVAALALAPLVLVAWRDGQVSERERGAVLRAAEQHGVEPSSTAFGLVEKWLANRPGPELLEAWSGYVAALRAKLSKDAFAALRADVLTRTREVAKIAGGILGVRSVSKGEKELIAEIEAALQ
jgi:hypothetical protein